MSEVLYPGAPVLLVDDEPSWLRYLGMILQKAGITNTLKCQEGGKVLEILGAHPVSAIALDLNMPDIHGEALLKKIVGEHPELKTIVVTGTEEVETVVRCMKAGAFNYFVKSMESNLLVSGIQRAIEQWQLSQENRMLKERLLDRQLMQPEAFAAFATIDKRMLGIFQYVEAIASSAQTILITGESGVGKELIARAIHSVSRRTGPYVALNTAGLDEGMFSDTLFGHKRGAFTGADTDRPGLVNRATNGTLFLDEVGDLSLTCQVKLLRLCQEREYTPLGSDLHKKTNARIIVATNQNLHALMDQGRFRKDLFFRLATHTIHVPPLRERKHDIPRLLDVLLERASEALHKPVPTPPPQLYTLLQSFSFPGNVRELEGMVFDAVTRHRSRMLSMDSFKTHIQAYGGPDRKADSQHIEERKWASYSEPLPTLAEAASMLVEEAMERAGRNQSIAASMLGVTRQALNRRLRIPRKP